jgi:murein DD-endopeptidase MepM/ murein hydrolase activator NlpD
MGSRWLAVLVVVAAVAVGAAAPGAVAVTPGGAAARVWERPVDGPVVRPFSVGPDRFAAGQHRGVDLAAPPAAPVRAACGGRVTFAGRVPRGGLTVSLRCGRLLATHQHLGAIVVRRGQVVLPGAGIGRAGNPWPRPHVHLGARVVATGAYVDPLGLLVGAPRALPPPLPGVRRPPPLAGARRPRPLRSPLPVGPAPVGAPRPAHAPARGVAVRPAPVDASRPAHALARDIPGTAGEASAPAPRMPWLVWLGLALFGLGLPLGGLVRVHARRRRAGAAVARTAS